VKSQILRIENKPEILGSKFHFAFFWLVVVWPHRKQDVFQQFSDWFILENSDRFLWIHISNTSVFPFNLSDTNNNESIILVAYRFCASNNKVLKTLYVTRVHWARSESSRGETMDTSNFETFSKSTDYLLCDSLSGELIFKTKLICNFLVF